MKPEETAIPLYRSPQEIATRINVTRQAVYHAIKRGELPSVTLFGKIRVRESDVLRYISEREARR